jgi:hypothetical protein
MAHFDLSTYHLAILDLFSIAMQMLEETEARAVWEMEGQFFPGAKIPWEVYANIARNFGSNM